MVLVERAQLVKTPPVSKIRNYSEFFHFTLLRYSVSIVLEPKLHHAGSKRTANKDKKIISQFLSD